MRGTLFLTNTSWLIGIVLACQIQPAFGVDFESFEFNDANLTELDSAANTANPANQWSTDINVLTDSFVESGVYKIAKFNDGFSDNFLQIDNIDPNTSGSRFIVAEMSGWDIRGFDAANPEEIRFAFLNDDTGTSGSTVAAQVQIARNTTTEAMEIEGNAIGPGSSNLSTALTVNTVQSNPFTMVLELNKISNTYEVFFKDDTNPSQSLGTGSVSPNRDGNSIRFVINNNFGSDIDEFFSIERIALTDTNPLTDLLTLEVERTTGAMKLINTTGAALSGLESYSITSGLGALDSSDWKPITDNYDNLAGPGDGSVDLDDDWAIDTSSTIALGESAQGGDGGNLTMGQEVLFSLDPNDGPWIQNPTEDLQMELMFTGGVTRRANVNFVGNGGKRFEVGDLNFDGSLTATDWTIFIAAAETDLSGLSIAQAYQSGDLDGDGVNSIVDFGLFKTAFDAANGLGAFEAMLAGIPEPTSAALLAFGMIGLASLRQRRRRTDPQYHDLHIDGPQTSSAMTSKEPSMYLKFRNTHLCWALGLIVATLVAPPASATDFEDFQFGDSNGTLLGAAGNTANPGNFWVEDTADMTFSSVLNGVYRIQKDTATDPFPMDGFGQNYLQIDNITTGTVWLVAEMAGWSFSSLVGPDEFDSSQREEIRFGFLDNDTGNSGSTITAQVEIERNGGTGGIEINGQALGTGTNIAAQGLSLNQPQPFTTVLQLNKTANTYEIFIDDSSGGGFASIGSGNVDPTRNGNSIRFVANNSFAGTGEFFDIDRILLTDVNPINVPTDALTLRINTDNGATAILNDSATSFEIDSYRIESTTDDLNFAGWNSFSDQNLDAVDGPDPNSIAGDGIGETWDEAGGSDNGVLAESFLLGSSVFGTNRIESLGLAYDFTGDPNSLSFRYRNATNGTLFNGNIEVVTSNADFDGDSFVTGLDFLIWQQNVGLTGQLDNSNGDADGNGTVDDADLTVWEGQLGTSPLSAVTSAVPEPTTGGLFALALVAMTLGLRKRTTE